jgi:hypothetical protein
MGQDASVARSETEEVLNDFVCIVDERQKWAHISIPKCACTSIRRALEIHFGLEPAENVHGREWPKQVDRAWLDNHPEYLTWSIVRDPRDRLVSVWADKTQRRGIPGLAQCYRDLHGCTFPEFVQWVRTINVETTAADPHIRAASWWFDGTFRQHVLLVFCQRHLGGAWLKLQSRFGLPDLKHRNKTEHPPRRDLVTPELDAIIKQAYWQDFRAWTFG